MRITIRTILVSFLFSVVLFAQESGKDLTQAQTNFDNPTVVTTPGESSPSGTLSESFEDPTFPPPGWSTLNPDGGTGWNRLMVGTTPIPGWTGGIITAPPGGGSYVAFCTWNTGGATSNNQWLVSTQITNVQLEDSLKFWLWIPGFTNGAYLDSVDILISTTGNSAGEFTIVVDQLSWPAGSADTSWTQYCYRLGDFVSAGDDIYIAWREHVSDNFNDGAAVCLDLVEVVGSGGTVTIAYAIEDLDGDFIPDHLGETVTVEGVVIGPNFQTTNNSFYIWDQVTTSSFGASRGTDIFMFGPPVFDWQLGDLLQITGEVDQFNGMTEIIPVDSSGWVLVSSGNPVPGPIVLTLAQYKADPEAYEGSLVGFISLTLVGGTWPASGSTNLEFSDGIDTVTFRIDSDTDIPGQPEPIWPRDILGVGSQFDSSPPFDSGYQIFPRYYATDFLPPGTIPVELTSFTAQVSNRVVTLNWTTATELNNQMFEIERRSEDGQYIMIGYVNGHGTTTEPQEYSYIDNTVEIGTFFYRLKQIDFGGRYAYSDVVQVDVVAPTNFTLEQNYPNPFNPSTKITFNLAVDSKVSLKVFDVLGQEVTNLITTNMTAGVHEINFNASNINSGVYFYRIDATGVDGTNFTSVKKMILTK